MQAIEITASRAGLAPLRGPRDCEEDHRRRAAAAGRPAAGREDEGAPGLLGERAVLRPPQVARNRGRLTPSRAGVGVPSLSTQPGPRAADGGWKETPHAAPPRTRRRRRTRSRSRRSTRRGDVGGRGCRTRPAPAGSRSQATGSSWGPPRGRSHGPRRHGERAALRPRRPRGRRRHRGPRVAQRDLRRHRPGEGGLGRAGTAVAIGRSTLVVLLAGRRSRRRTRPGSRSRASPAASIAMRRWPTRCAGWRGTRCRCSSRARAAGQGARRSRAPPRGAPREQPVRRHQRHGVPA